MVWPVNNHGIDCDCPACWSSVFDVRDPPFNAFTRVHEGTRLWSFRGEISEKDIPGLIRTLTKRIGEIKVGTAVTMDQAQQGIQHGEIIEVSNSRGASLFKIQYGPGEHDWVRLPRGEFSIKGTD